MVTLSVTRYRIANVLNRAADIVTVDGWYPARRPVMRAIDAAAGFIPGNGSPDAEDTTLQAFDALATHLQCPVGTWERIPGLTAGDVAQALREAARAVTG
ncbi:DUF6197 family protein [Streptomyces sp. HC307]|uniref:DUF6197 family protein n=1 Tax=Streptomyces flavusporus TaxID=3385496 RepID=UPI003916D359